MSTGIRNFKKHITYINYLFINHVLELYAHISLIITITSKGRCHYMCFIGGTHRIQDAYIFKGNTASKC